MKLNIKRTLLVGLGFFTISAFWQMYDFSIPLILKNVFNVSDTLSGFIMSADNVIALFLLPFFGSLSDRVTTKWGKRMPFIVVGTVLTIIALMMIPVAATSQNIILFTVFLAILLFSIAIYRSPAVALMPDITIKPLRSKGNAIINFMGAIGGVLALLMIKYLSYEMTGNYYALFIAISALMAFGVIFMIFGVRENQWVKEMQQQTLDLNILEEDALDHHDSTSIISKEIRNSLRYMLLSIAFWFMGYNAVTTAFSRYATLYINVSEKDATNILLVATIGAIVSYIPIGWLSTKLGKKKMIRLGILLLAFAFGSAFFYTKFTPLMYVNFLVAGFAWAAINVNSLPMVLEMAKGSQVGQYTGLYYTFSMSAQIITPILSGWLFDTFAMGYGILLPYATFFVLCSFVTMSQVKHGDHLKVEDHQ